MTDEMQPNAPKRRAKVMKVTLYYDPICKTFSTEDELLDCHEGEPHYGVAVKVDVPIPGGENDD